MRQRAALMSGTAIAPVIDAIQWLELFMGQLLRDNYLNGGPGFMWLVNNTHPMFYRIRSEFGTMQILWEPHMVGRKLHINMPPARA